MSVLIIVLLVAAVVCFLLETFNVAVRPNLIALGLLCWVLAVLLPHVIS
jgi:hypothetical protein